MIATIYDLPAAGSSKLLRDFFIAEVQAMKAALAAVASAPSIRIARDLFEDVRPRLAAALGVAISQDDSPSAAATCDTAIEPQEQRDLCAGWLVLSGWTRLAADEQDEYDVAPLLGCRMCHRVLGAWCFRENGIDPFQQHRPFCAFMRKEKKRSNASRVETEYVDTQQQRHDATPRFIWAELLLAAAGSKHDAALERMRDLLQRPFMASAEE